MKFANTKYSAAVAACACMLFKSSTKVVSEETLGRAFKRIRTVGVGLFFGFGVRMLKRFRTVGVGLFVGFGVNYIFFVLSWVV